MLNSWLELVCSNFLSSSLKLQPWEWLCADHFIADTEYKISSFWAVLIKLGWQTSINNETMRHCKGQLSLVVDTICMHVRGLIQVDQHRLPSFVYPTHKLSMFCVVKPCLRTVQQNLACGVLCYCKNEHIDAMWTTWHVDWLVHMQMSMLWICLWSSRECNIFS